MIKGGKSRKNKAGLQCLGSTVSYLISCCSFAGLLQLLALNSHSKRQISRSPSSQVVSIDDGSGPGVAEVSRAPTTPPRIPGSQDGGSFCAPSYGGGGP